MSAIIKTKKDRELLAKWNKKLEGRNDCENYGENLEPRLKHYDSYHFQKITPDQYYSRETYYSNARALLSTGTFDSAIDKRIWEYHSEGLALRKIATAINRRGYTKDIINRIIKKIIKEQMPK